MLEGIIKHEENNMFSEVEKKVDDVPDVQINFALYSSPAFHQQNQQRLDLARGNIQVNTRIDRMDNSYGSPWRNDINRGWDKDDYRNSPWGTSHIQKNDNFNEPAKDYWKPEPINPVRINQPDDFSHGYDLPNSGAQIHFHGNNGNISHGHIKDYNQVHLVKNMNAYESAIADRHAMDLGLKRFDNPSNRFDRFDNDKF